MFPSSTPVEMALRRPRRATILRGSIAIVFSASLIAGIGCGDTKVSVSPAPAPAPAPASDSAAKPADARSDALAEILQRAKVGDVDTAVQLFVSGAADNWIESTGLEDLRMSEAAFSVLDRAEKSRFQQLFIDRVGEIKGFAGTVIDRANAAKQKGELETAKKYLEAVNRLGRQLRDAHIVTVYQQTGKVLAEAKLSD